MTKQFSNCSTMKIKALLSFETSASVYHRRDVNIAEESSAIPLRIPRISHSPSSFHYVLPSLKGHLRINSEEETERGTEVALWTINYYICVGSEFLLLAVNFHKTWGFHCVFWEDQPREIETKRFGCHVTSWRQWHKSPKFYSDLTRLNARNSMWFWPCIVVNMWK